MDGLNKLLDAVEDKIAELDNGTFVQSSSNIEATETITAAAGIETKSDLQQAIENILDPDLCGQVVSIGFSEDGQFDRDVFIDTDEFFKSNLDALSSMDVALKFFNGSDLDSKGPANPNREYMRFDGAKNIETTDDPDEIYFDIIFDDIINYIMDHVDDTEFPDAIQELIDEYLANNEEE